MSYFVYLIGTRNKHKLTTYVGYTNNLVKRLQGYANKIPGLGTYVNKIVQEIEEKVENPKAFFLDALPVDSVNQLSR